MSGSIEIGNTDVFIIVDMQNDFCPGGALAVPEGDAIVPIINRLARSFANVVLTQDWHPRDHMSFASNHAGYRPFDTLHLPEGAQTLWPDHCVQGTAGADFHPGLDVPQASLIIRKGFHPKIDSYSAFQENDRHTKTGLAGCLAERGLTRVFLAGLAYDFCVRYSAEDAAAAGFAVVVIEDACRGLDIDGSIDATRTTLNALGCASAHAAAIVSSDEG